MTICSENLWGNNPPRYGYASISAFNRLILLRSSLLAVEEPVDYLDAPEACPLIWLAEPCTSVQC